MKTLKDTIYVLLTQIISKVRVTFCKEFLERTERKIYILYVEYSFGGDIKKWDNLMTMRKTNYPTC